jgi:hypothetical protein
LPLFPSTQAITLTRSSVPLKYVPDVLQPRIRNQIACRRIVANSTKTIWILHNACRATNYLRVVERTDSESSCLRELAGTSVKNLMALPTKRDQVGFCIIANSAPPCHMMNVEIPRASTALTAPTISLQDFAAQQRIKVM